jgi:catechol 2,3-dioxygenase-like lactoylglutathione lyase family enzyme
MAIVCQDMDKMLDFYVGVLGLTPVSDAQAAPENSTKLGTSPHGFRIIRLQTPYGERIKLVQPLQEVPAARPFSRWVMAQPGYSYLTFIVSNLPEVVQRLKEKGIKTLSEAPVESRPGVFAYFSLDPENNYVEFVTYPDLAAYRPDLFGR